MDYPYSPAEGYPAQTEFTAESAEELYSLGWDFPISGDATAVLAATPPEVP